MSTVAEKTYANSAMAVEFAPTGGRCCTVASALGLSVGASMAGSAASARCAFMDNELKHVDEIHLGLVGFRVRSYNI